MGARKDEEAVEVKTCCDPVVHTATSQHVRIVGRRRGRDGVGAGWTVVR